jgi:hypothetical protein
LLTFREGKFCNASPLAVPTETVKWLETALVEADNRSLVLFIVAMR